MDSENILKIILGAFFLLLGFFNKSKDKKKRVSKPVSPTRKSKPMFELPDMGSILEPIKSLKKEATHKPQQSGATGDYKRPEFVSSLDLVSNFGKDNTSSIFSSANQLYDDADMEYGVGDAHPIIEGFRSWDNVDEFRKAIVYSEILQRRY